MKQWNSKDIKKYKPLVFLMGLFPFLRWLVLAFFVDNGLTVNPQEFFTRSSGIWALTFLAITLCVTPLRKIIKQPALVQLRRMLGLFTYFYAFLHMLTWLWWDRDFDPQAMISDLIQKPYIWFGAIAFIGLTLLALTSTNGWMRRLGKRWTQLHKLVYLIAILTPIHFYIIRLGKHNLFQPYIYIAVFAVLLLYRAYKKYGTQRLAAASTK